MPQTLAWTLALIAGVGLSAQIAVNVHLRQGVGHPAIAAFFSFVVGAVVLGLYALAARLSWPSFAQLARVPVWAWVGGLFGAYYVGSTIALGPRLGAALFVVLVIAGQLAAALAIDHFGWLAAAPHPLNGWRVVGALLVAAGVLIIQRH